MGVPLVIHLIFGFSMTPASLGYRDPHLWKLWQFCPCPKASKWRHGESKHEMWYPWWHRVNLGWSDGKLLETEKYFGWPWFFQQSQDHPNIIKNQGDRDPEAVSVMAPGRCVRRVIGALRQIRMWMVRSGYFVAIKHHFFISKSS